MTNQQQEQNKPNVSATDLQKALEEREQAKQTQSKPQVTLADLFDVDHTSSEEVQQFIKNNESFGTNLALSVACFICCVVPVILLADTFLEGIGVISMFALIAFGVVNIISKSKLVKNNPSFLNNLVLNDDDYDMTNDLYKKAQATKGRDLTIGILSICFSFTPIILLAESFLELPAVSMMFILIGFGVGMIIKTSNHASFLKLMLNADQRNHEKYR